MPFIDTSIQLPKKSFPIYIIGAGGIVNDAHLPAYNIAGFFVAAIYDIDSEKALATAKKFQVEQVFESLPEMIAAAPVDAVFDIALPATEISNVLGQLPAGASVLIQKPFGENLAGAKALYRLIKEQQMIAGVNFQLRYAPYIVAARNIISQGLIGELCDVDININVYTPWHLWSFLYELPRVEILYHSIHYVDLVRSFLGDPVSIFAKSVKHPAMKELASVRTNMIFDYGDFVRANIVTNHCHRFGLHNQHAFIKFEGTKGAIKITPGSLMNYPKGVPDSLEYVVLEDKVMDEPGWNKIELNGSWFPDAFIGTMAQVMLAKEGTISAPGNSVEDAVHTMACVEAAYISNARGGIRLNDIL